MKSGHICICISVGCVSFFGCMAIEPVGTLALIAGAVSGVVCWVRSVTKEEDNED